MLDIEDPAALVSYLRASGRVGRDETPRVRVLAGGVSNKTVLVEHDAGGSWVLKQALPKLRVQTDWFSDPARIRREAEGLRWLPKFAPPGSITPLVFEDPANNLLAMRAVPTPHENWKSMLLAGRLEEENVRQFATMLGQIHRKSAEAGAEVRAAFDDRSFFESLRVEPYYAYTASHVPEAADFLHDLIRGTRARRLALVHGDYSPKNVLVHAGRLVLLDHEVIHLGDPAFDVGFAMTHLLSKAHHLKSHRDRFADAARIFWTAYADRGSEPWAVRHTLGCLLARVAGRSPLEYLDAATRTRQSGVVVRLMQAPPATVGDLVDAFVTEISHARD
jgi:aminoglycoside phosphotransferase (APT) family kinase protein